MKDFKKMERYLRSNKILFSLVAEKLGISKAFYCQIENGSRKLSYEMAVKIADIFNCKPDNLFYNDFIQQKRKEN